MCVSYYHKCVLSLRLRLLMLTLSTESAPHQVEPDAQHMVFYVKHAEIDKYLCSSLLYEDTIHISCTFQKG